MGVRVPNGSPILHRATEALASRELSRADSTASKEVMKAREDLRRELGFWTALTIGAGTMIGAGIFLLAGVAVEAAGPGAIFSYLLAGLVCLLTASSAAELATGMPTSGGDYFFVSRALGPALGAISGVGIWLSLTVAIAFYLFGLGEYLSQFLPVTPFWAAMGGGILLTALNVIGAKESGRMQVAVVLTLLGILGAFIGFGFFHMEGENLAPFLPFGSEPILATTALVFVSFLGFVKIAAVAEEVRDPGRNLPRALIGSVALVTVLYVLIVLIIAGVFSQRTIGAVRDPLTAAAREMMGGTGGAIIIFAGLLATISSANASIMASSRINLAMARDRLVPGWFSAIHERLLTPHRAILVTGLVALSFLFLQSLEDLAKIASSLQLYSYAALNVGCVVLRTSGPEWYRPSFRAPFHPWAQLLAASGCLAIILYSGLFAQIAVGGLILFSLAWYLVWGRSRVEIEHAVPEFRSRWADLKLRAFFKPAAGFEKLEAAAEPLERELDTEAPRRIMVALGNPEHEGDLLGLGRLLAAGAEAGGSVMGTHLVRVPIQTPLREARERYREGRTVEEIIETAGRVAAAERPGPVAETEVEAVTDVAHDVFDGLVEEVRARGGDLLLMGWQGDFTLGRIRRSPVQRVMSNVRADMAVLKDRGLEEMDSILLPWGGGPHARLGLELAVRLARTTGATVHVLRVVKPEVKEEGEEERLREAVETIVGRRPELRYHVRSAPSVVGGIEGWLEEHPPQLVVIGASSEFRLRSVLFGSIPDIVADLAPCSVLMARRYFPEHWSLRLGEGVKRFLERLGWTTSPQETG
jgi:amino acid transporter